MHERLRVLILDDKKKGIEEDLWGLKPYAEYMDCAIFTTLDKALQFLSENYKNLHIVLSDFRLDDAAGHATHLKTPDEDKYVHFEKPLTTAMGANITIFTEALMKKYGCTIIVNKLYTVEDAYLETFSLESHLLYKYYLTREGILRPFDTTNKTIDSNMDELMEEALQEAQNFFFSHAETVGEVLRGLHVVINLPMVAKSRKINIADRDKVKDFLKEVTREEKESLRRGVEGVLHQYLTAYRMDTKIKLPIAAIFPKLQFRFNQYLASFALKWAPKHFRNLKSLIHELEMMQHSCRDKTQEFGIYLYEHEILHFFHNQEDKIGDDKGKLQEKILQDAKEPPLNEIHGLEKILQYLKEHYSEMNKPNQKNSFVRYFKEGVTAKSGIEIEFTEEDLPALPFLGFELDNQIVEQLIDSLGEQDLGLTLTKGDETFEVRGNDDKVLGTRIFTDKSRILKAAKDLLGEVSRYAYNQEDKSKEVKISYTYDAVLHCAKLVFEDYGVGIPNGELEAVGDGAHKVGGWADIRDALKGWVEDIWILTNTGNKPEERAFFRDKKNINECKETKGTKVVILFNLISVIN